MLSKYLRINKNSIFFPLMNDVTYSIEILGNIEYASQGF